MPCLRRLALGTHAPGEDEFAGFLTQVFTSFLLSKALMLITPFFSQKTIFPLLHLLRMFPALRYLNLPQAFNSSSNLSDFVSASDEELSILHPTLSIFLEKIVEQTVLVMLNLGKIDFHRPDKSAREWKKDLMIDQLLYE